MSKRKNENELEEHEKPSTKRERFKSGPANQKFLPLYHELWPCLERSDKGDAFENGSFIFKELSQLMLSILTIPQSSAHCERVFSTVRKNRTEK